MDEVQEHESARSAARSGRGAAFLLICALAATIALCGWNMRWTSSGPTSVTIVGLNGPAAAENDSAVYGMVAPTELVANR